MKPNPAWSSLRSPVKFRIPTAENLVPIRLDIDIDGQRYKDTFTWNPSDPDSDVSLFAKRTVKDLKLPPPFITQIAQSIQIQTPLASYSLAEMICFPGNNPVCSTNSPRKTRTPARSHAVATTRKIKTLTIQPARPTHPEK